MFVQYRGFKSLVVACVVSSVSSVWAQAQQSSVPLAPAEQAALESPAGDTVSGAGASEPTAQSGDSNSTLAPEVVQEARRRFDRGIRLYGEGDFALALIEFERAYELVANYRVLYNIGQVSIQLRRYAKAREALEQYLSEGGAEVESTRLQEVQADIDMLRPRTAKLLVTTNAPRAKVSLDGAPLGALPLSGPVLVDAGNHVVKVEAAGYQSGEKSVVLAGGDESTLAITLDVIRPARTVEKQTIVVHEGAKADNTWKWVGWGATGVLAAGAITTGIFGLNSAAKLEDLINTAGVSHEELSSEQSRARRMFIATDILAAGAVAAAAVSLYLTVGGDDTEQAGKVAVTVGPSALTVRSVF